MDSSREAQVAEMARLFLKGCGLIQAARTEGDTEAWFRRFNAALNEQYTEGNVTDADCEPEYRGPGDPYDCF